MIFSKEIQQICAYCEHGKPILGKNDVICSKKGLVPATHSCRKFLYTPLRRTPPRPISPDILEALDLEDLSEI